VLETSYRSILLHYSSWKLKMKGLAAIKWRFSKIILKLTMQ